MFCTKSAEMPTDAEGDKRGDREGGREVWQGLPCSNKDVAPQAAAWPLAVAASACQTNVFCFIYFRLHNVAYTQCQRAAYACYTLLCLFCSLCHVLPLLNYCLQIFLSVC